LSKVIIIGKYISLIEINYVWGGKSGSFGFGDGSALCVEAKPNVPLVQLAKIVFKKVRWGKKIKNIGSD
jgi:hypothetical protein